MDSFFDTKHRNSWSSKLSFLGHRSKISIERNSSSRDRVASWQQYPFDRVHWQARRAERFRYSRWSYRQVHWRKCSDSSSCKCLVSIFRVLLWYCFLNKAMFIIHILFTSGNWQKDHGKANRGAGGKISWQSNWDSKIQQPLGSQNYCWIWFYSDPK